jgi:hypothetical protein
MVSNFDIVDEFPTLDYHSGAFMASNQVRFGFEWPVSVQGV